MKFFHSKGSAEDHPVGSLPRELAMYLIVVLILWAISLFNVSHPWCVINLNARFIGLLRLDPQGDLLCCRVNLNSLHTADFFNKGYSWNYPAPCVLIYQFFYLFQPLGSSAVVAAYFVAVILPIVFFASMLQNAMSRRGLTRARAVFFVSAAAVLSWPICYSLERGNIEALLWLGLALSIVAYFRGQLMLAAILIGIVATFKLYPLLFFALFLRPRRYREIAAGLGASLVTTVVSLLYVGPTLGAATWYTLRGIHRFIKGFSSNNSPGDLTLDHSAFVLVKLLTASHPQSIASYLPRYELLAATIALAIFFIRTWKMPRANQVLMLSSCMVLLPATSFDYTLQSLYIPWAWLCLLIITSHRVGKRIPGAMAAMLCFAVLLAPEIFLDPGQRLFAGPLKALVLMALIGISMIYPFVDEDRSPGLLAA
jgi:hypothetical protein